MYRLTENISKQGESVSSFPWLDKYKTATPEQEEVFDAISEGEIMSLLPGTVASFV